MGRAAIVRRRRDKRRPFLGLPDRWVVTGTDQHGEPFVATGGLPGDGQQTQAEAEAVAARINRKGGSVVVVHQQWSGPAAAYRPTLAGEF